MNTPQPGQTINVRLKQEFGGALVTGVFDGNPFEDQWRLTDVCYADTFKQIGNLNVWLEAVESFEVV